MTMQWGIVARSRSTGIQIRKPLAQPYTDPEAAIDAANLWQAELNTESKFGLNDWLARYDHVEGGPTETNVVPTMIEHPENAQPNRAMPEGQTMGMNGRL
jgi:hypothetical protein